MLICFDYSGNMEINTATTRLSALAHDTRLAIFRRLVTAGPAGIAAGAIGDSLALPPATLSFHLNHLANAGLAERRREGRQIFYSANYPAMNALIDFLTENCCEADPSCGEGERNAENDATSSNS